MERYEKHRALWKLGEEAMTVLTFLREGGVQDERFFSWVFGFSRGKPVSKEKSSISLGT